MANFVIGSAGLSSCAAVMAWPLHVRMRNGCSCAALTGCLLWYGSARLARQLSAHYGCLMAVALVGVVA